MIRNYEEMLNGFHAGIWAFDETIYDGYESPWGRGSDTRECVRREVAAGLSLPRHEAR